MKNILIIPNTQKDQSYSVSTRIAEVLASLGLSVFVEDRYNTDLNKIATVVDKIDEQIELIVVIGGDGSVIDASVPAVSYGIPVLGVNLGHLGYLAEVELSNLSVFEKLVNGEYAIEDKMLLSVTVTEEGELIKSARFAVNDVIISHDSYVGLAELQMRVNNCGSVKYRADGLILSTPVGSTAYNLSAGGPIISHDIDSIVATPICPHSFFNRSVIFNPEDVITIFNQGADSLNVTVDGRFFAKLSPGGQCFVRMSEKKFKMLTFNENNMFSTLFGKMKKIENI